jgi:hypothetical protein
MEEAFTEGRRTLRLTFEADDGAVNAVRIALNSVLRAWGMSQYAERAMSAIVNTIQVVTIDGMRGLALSASDAYDIEGNQHLVLEIEAPGPAELPMLSTKERDSITHGDVVTHYNGVFSFAEDRRAVSVRYRIG